VFSARVDTFWQNDQIIFTVPLPGNTGVRNIDGWAYAVGQRAHPVHGDPLEKGSLDLYAFGKNLFDRKYRTWASTSAIRWALPPPPTAPPHVRVGMTYNFNQGEVAPPPPPVAQAAPPPPPPPAKKKIVLRSVHFDFDKATLKAEAKPILDEAVQVLKQEGSVDIVVEGHTDSVGTDQYNLGCRAGAQRPCAATWSTTASPSRGSRRRPGRVEAGGVERHRGRPRAEPPGGTARQVGASALTACRRPQCGRRHPPFWGWGRPLPMSMGPAGLAAAPEGGNWLPMHARIDLCGCGTRAALTLAGRVTLSLLAANGKPISIPRPAVISRVSL